MSREFGLYVLASSLVIFSSALLFQPGWTYITGLGFLGVLVGLHLVRYSGKIDK